MSISSQTILRTMPRPSVSRISPVVLVLLMLGAAPTFAQEGGYDQTVYFELWRIGLYAGPGWLGYSADMQGLPGVPSCCPEYEAGSGSSLDVGLSAEHNLAGSLYGSLRLLYSQYNGTLRAEEYELVTADRDTVTATFEHTIEATQPALGTELSLLFEPVERFRLIGGGRLDLMLGGSYHQQEQILFPDNIRYENDLRQRLVFDGSIPERSSLHLSVLLGARYDIPLKADETLVLSPEIQVWHGFTELVEGTSWTMEGIRVGVSLYFVGRAGEETPSPLQPGQPGVPRE